MYNLIEYRIITLWNYYYHLWNYYRDEPNSSLGGDDNYINYSIKNSKSFDNKTSITRKLEDGNREKEEVEIVVPSKHLRKFGRPLDMPLINCEVFFTLTWSENFVITSKEHRRAVAAQGNNPEVAGINNPTSATSKITDTKLYAPAVTLSTKDDSKILEQ